MLLRLKKKRILIAPLSENPDKIREIQDITRKTLVDLSNYRFNRNEANSYDE